MKGAQFKTDFLKLIFNAVDIPGLGVCDPPNVSPYPRLRLSLHTEAPHYNTTTGQLLSTSQISFNEYLITSPFRDTVTWVVSGNTVTLNEDRTWGKSTGGTGGTITHFGISYQDPNDLLVKLLFWGTVTPNIEIVVGSQPILAIGSTLVMN